MKYDLTGKWNLILDSDKTGIKNGFFKDFKSDVFIMLPGSVSQQKKSPETTEKSIGFLTDPYKFEGWAWFEKTIKNDKTFETGNYRLILERTRNTTLWINGKEIGSNNSLNGKHIYDFSLTETNDELKIVLLVSNVDYIVPGGHMTSPDTQTNWLGITGEISLIKLDSNRIENLKVKALYNTEISKPELSIDFELLVENDCEIEMKISNLFNKKVNAKIGLNHYDFELSEKTLLWSDNSPNLYKLELLPDFDSCSEKYEVTIGFRTFKTNGKFFECNGKKVFLRGKHDGMIFPDTGFAPTDVESWVKVMKTAKNYGINHYRFHTCCPPEAAFIAADQLGIYMSPELPFWGTIQAPDEEGFNQKQQEYLINEGFKILETFSNHPSFVMMSMGNELWGSEKRLDEIMENYHKFDSTRLYTGGSNNFQFWPRTTEHEDYFVGVRFGHDALIRGSYAQCDAPLGFVQTDEPNAHHNYDVFFNNNSNDVETSDSEKEIEIQFGTGVKKVKSSGQSSQFVPNKPCISHEVGQYCMYPNFEENKRFTGVLKPYNFEEFKTRLNNSGMGNRAGDFFRDSSRFAVQCYKTEIEAALRSNELAGFQLLDIQDFTGQGTAVVGVLNAFMESKGVVSGKQWQSFCSETVLLAEFEKFVWQNGEELSAEIILHNYSNLDFNGNFVTAYIINTETDEILCEEEFEINKSILGNQKLGNFKFDFEDINEYQKLSFMLLMNCETADDPENCIINSYTLHVYPECDKEIDSVLNQLNEKETVEFSNVILTKSKQIAEQNPGKVIYFQTDFENIETVPGTYCTDFWCYPMFRSISESMNKPVPVGTLGLTIQNDDLLLKDFPTDTYTTPKWYNIVSHSTCVNLGKKEIVPAIQMIDNFERNWKLGILWEENEMVICTSRLWEIAQKPEVNYFLKGLIQYLK